MKNKLRTSLSIACQKTAFKLGYSIFINFKMIITFWPVSVTFLKGTTVYTIYMSWSRADVYLTSPKWLMTNLGRLTFRTYNHILNDGLEIFKLMVSRGSSYYFRRLPNDFCCSWSHRISYGFLIFRSRFVWYRTYSSLTNCLYSYDCYQRLKQLDNCQLIWIIERKDEWSGHREYVMWH